MFILTDYAGIEEFSLSGMVVYLGTGGAGY
jgi:hypothetical protein